MSQAPKWFLKALDTPGQIRQVMSHNCRIEYLFWGEPQKPLLMLVHGNGGHANWWDFIAPSFMTDYCVCAIHLAGMGNSGHRPEYHFDSYADDLIAVAEDLNHSKALTLIGHSMGGVVCMRAAENHPKKIRNLVIIDTPMIFRRADDPPDSHKPPPPAHHKFSGKKYYPSFEEALGRFRLVPPQTCKNQFLVDHVGKHSIRQYEQGWSWKFDDGIYFNFKRDPGRPPFNIERILCGLAYLYADDSALVPQNIVTDIHELLRNKGPVIEIPNAHHHVLLDEPLRLIDEIQKILQSFDR